MPSYRERRREGLRLLPLRPRPFVLFSLAKSGIKTPAARQCAPALGSLGTLSTPARHCLWHCACFRFRPL